MNVQSTVVELRPEESHVSYTSLSTWLQCPQKWRYRYDLKAKPDFRPGALAFGSAIHSTLAIYFSAMKDGAEPPSLANVFAETWLLQLDSEVPVLLDVKQTPDTLLKMGQAMLTAYVDQIPEPHKVVGVEERFNIEITDPVTGEVLTPRLIGVMDLVVQDEDGTYRIVEVKTAARKWSETRLANDAQITAYSLAAPMVGLGNASVDIHLLLKTKSPAVEVYSPTRTEGDRREFLRLASGIIRACEAGICFKRRDWWCKSCEFAGSCLDG